MLCGWRVCQSGVTSQKEPPFGEAVGEQCARLDSRGSHRNWEREMRRFR